MNRDCPTCNTEVSDPNPGADSWYCENDNCPTVLFDEDGALAWEDDDA